MANDIGNAILSGDKVGNWWMLHADGTMEASSSLTESPVGSPGTNPITLNGSTQYFESTGQLFPAGDFSAVVCCKFTSLPTFFDILGQWHNSTAAKQRWIVEGDNTGGLTFYIHDSGGTLQFVAHSGLTSGSDLFFGVRFTVATGKLEVRLLGTTVSATPNTGLVATSSQPHTFGARTGGSLFTPMANGYGAFFTEKVLSDADIDRIGAMVVPSPTSSKFLRINQLPVSVLQSGEASADVEEIGTSDRAQDGSLRIERRGIKGKWNFKLAHLKATDALAWRDLILGRGHHFSFDSTLYSSKGLPVVGAAGSVSATHAKFGASSLKVTSGNSVTITGALKGTAAGWGYLVHYWRWNGTAFDAFMHLADGSVYVNGTISGPVGGPPVHKWVTIASSGVVTLAGVDSGSSPGANADQWFDDLVLLNLGAGVAGAVPASWPVDWAAMTLAFSDLAQLRLDGLGIEGNARAVTVKGATGQASMMSGTLAGTFYGNLHVLPASFEEI